MFSWGYFSVICFFTNTKQSCPDLFRMVLIVGFGFPWLPHRGFGPWPQLTDHGKILTTVIHHPRGGNKELEGNYSNHLV